MNAKMNYNRVQRLNSLGINLMQINKNKAERLYNEGKTIYLLPCKMSLNNIWMQPATINKNNYSNGFKSEINGYDYYNCNSELGTYVKFYVEL